MNYETSTGPGSAELARINQEVLSCSYGLCAYREVMGFDVPRSLLNEIVARYSTDGVNFWRFRFKGQGGLDWEDRISPAEVAGFLRAVDREVPAFK